MLFKTIKFRIPDLNFAWSRYDRHAKITLKILGKKTEVIFMAHSKNLILKAHQNPSKYCYS